MPLVNAKCTNCGATLEVDNTQVTSVCGYCGSAYFVEQAIQNYNYYVTNNINAENVIISGKGDAEKERLIKNANVNERFGDYEKAFQIYREITNDYPDEYRGWLGMVSISTNSFSKLDLEFEKFEELSTFMNKALVCAPSEEAAKIKSQWDAYVLQRNNLLAQHVQVLNNLYIQKNELNKHEQIINNNIDVYQNIVDTASTNVRTKQSGNFISRGWKKILFLGILLVVLGIFWNGLFIAIGSIVLIALIVNAIYQECAISYYKNIETDNNSLLSENKSRLNMLINEEDKITAEINRIKSRYHL
ncbi:MAG: hypothetical protein Q4A12_00075 [Eubacteriales bacterium]|nr:hypothetical protein [Eubacteriales bacterium]